ncbi:MAG: formate dehydrogenase subunit gamma [Caldimonas sp.]
MQRMIRARVLAAAALLALTGSAIAQSGAAQPQAAVVAAPPASEAALPQPNDTNAQRALSQPGNNAPFWRGVRNSGNRPGVIAMPGAEKGVLIQPFTQYPGSSFTTAGEAWRQVRNDWIIPYGGALVLISLLAIVLYYFAKGPIGGREADTGKRIERFTYFERAAHWSNAIAFCALAISGLTMAFGQFFLMPVMGHALFGWFTYALKTLHNFAGPLFVVSLLIVFFTFLRSEWPTAADFKWLRSAGGMFGGVEPASHRFNAGEKLIFWFGVVLFGSIVVASGLVLDKVIPGIAYVRTDMQVAHMVHSIAGLILTSMFLFHIYMGTIGMRGAYRAMKTGYVDEGWAREHHLLWYEDIEAGKIPVERSAPGPRVEQPAA